MNHLGDGGAYGGDGAGYGGDGVAGYSGPALIMVVLMIDSGNSTSTLMSIATVLV